MFYSGCFSISRYRKVKWYLSFWSLIDSLRGQSCVFELFTASDPCGPLRLTFVRIHCKISIDGSGTDLGKRVLYICSSSSSVKTKTLNVITCWCSGTGLCTEKETRFLIPCPSPSNFCSLSYITHLRMEMGNLKQIWRRTTLKSSTSASNPSVGHW